MPATERIVGVDHNLLGNRRPGQVLVQGGELMEAEPLNRPSPRPAPAPRSLIAGPSDQVLSAPLRGRHWTQGFDFLYETPVAGLRGPLLKLQHLTDPNQPMNFDVPE